MWTLNSHPGVQFMWKTLGDPRDNIILLYSYTYGIVDMSGFTLFEIMNAPGHGVPTTLGHRYMEALAYVGTEKKGLVMKHANGEE